MSTKHSDPGIVLSYRSGPSNDSRALDLRRLHPASNWGDARSLPVCGWAVGKEQTHTFIGCRPRTLIGPFKIDRALGACQHGPLSLIKIGGSDGLALDHNPILVIHAE